MRSYYDYDKEEERVKVFNTSLFILIIGLILQISIIFFVSKYLSIKILKSEQYYNLIKISVITTGINFINTGFFNYLRVKEKAVLYTVISSLSFILNVSITWCLLIYFDKSISSPIYSAIVAQSIVLFVLIFMHLKVINLFNINTKEIKVLLHFGLPSIFAGITIMIGEWGDKLLINEFLSKDELGLFSMAFRIALVYNVFIASPFTLVWSPLMMKLKNHKDVIGIFNKVTYLYFGISLIFIFAVYVLLEPILYLFGFDSKFARSLSYVPLLMIALSLGSLQNIYAAGIIYARKPILLVYTYLLVGILNFISSYFALLYYGINGVICTFISFKLITSLMIYYFSSTHFSFKIFSFDYLKLILICSSLFFIYFNYVADKFPLVVDFFYLILSFILLSYYLFKEGISRLLSYIRNRSLPSI